MKKKILLAFVLLIIGLVDVADWIIFSTSEGNENLSWTEFKSKYVARFPEFVQPLYQKPVITTTILIIFFTSSAIIFIKGKKKIFLALGILSFFMAGWQLFSLM